MPTLKTAQSLPLLAALLAGCAGLTPPVPAPVLTMTRPDADHARATLTPAPARARWTLQPSAECGSPPGPARSGDWPGVGPLLVRASPADLLTVQGDGWQVADCIPGDGD